jgi:uncharacterized protein YfdQ (DUF2303 family)
MNDKATLSTLAETTNIAETLAREMKSPETLFSLGSTDHHKIICLPPGWSAQTHDHEALLATPRRKIANVVLTDADSFIDYNQRHGSINHATLWCEADFLRGKLGFTAILNDHGAADTDQHWRDHKASYVPEKSVEWTTWIGKNNGSNAMGQMDFATFLEENLKDITATDDGMPSGSAMLQMAIDFEAKQDMRFKSAVRLQSGGVRMEYIADEDKNTVESMKVFERFQIAIPIFRDDTSRYPLTARLRYRQRDGKLAFWYELIRPDLVMEHSARALVENIRTRTGRPFFFGRPFA